MTESVQVGADEEMTEEMAPWELLLQGLEDAPHRLSEALDLYLRDTVRPRGVFPDPRVLTFIEAANKVLGEGSVVHCVRCNRVEWQEDSHTDSNGGVVCDPCRGDISSCERCGGWNVADPDLTWIGDEGYCSYCIDNYFSYCDDCDRYYSDDDGHQHGDVVCPCTPQPLKFTIPANSHGTLAEDERLLVELPEGHISDEALEAVVAVLWRDQFYAAWYADETAGQVSRNSLRRSIETMDRVWQTKRGTFTRRLSKLLHDEFGVKLNAGLLSRAGSTVRQHAGTSNKWWVEFTRDLNKPAEAFYNEDSCWWGSERESLCALKSWGGLAMRTYTSKSDPSDYPSGRAWIQPLNVEMKPTNDILNAHAYLVYNGYGDLEGYTGARLVSYLTSRTYKKLEVSIRGQYVNGESGYLIADQATCDATDSVYLRGLGHHTLVAA